MEASAMTDPARSEVDPVLVVLEAAGQEPWAQAPFTDKISPGGRNNWDGLFGTPDMRAVGLRAVNTAWKMRKALLIIADGDIRRPEQHASPEYARGFAAALAIAQGIARQALARAAMDGTQP